MTENRIEPFRIGLTAASLPCDESRRVLPPRAL